VESSIPKTCLRGFTVPKTCLLRIRAWS